MNRFWKIVFLWISWVYIPMSQALEIVPEAPHRYCEEMRLSNPIRVFKDPSVFLGNLSLLYSDPALGWEKLMEETPLLTIVEGKAHIMRLGEARPFRNFGAISRLYEAADPRLQVRWPADSFDLDSRPQDKNGALIIPIKFCGNIEGYADTVGFILKTDLERSQHSRQYEMGGAMPPSTRGNPVPLWPPQNSP